MFVLTALLMAASAGDGALLAPQVDDLTSSMAKLEVTLDGAASRRRALGDAHNRWALASMVGDPCEDPGAVSAGVEARALGHAHRDAVQASRAERERMRRYATSPTVSGLVTAGLRERMSALDAAVSMEVRLHLEFASWHATYVELRLPRCPEMTR